MQMVESLELTELTGQGQGHGEESYFWLCYHDHAPRPSGTIAQWWRVTVAMLTIPVASARHTRRIDNRQHSDEGLRTKHTDLNQLDQPGEQVHMQSNNVD